MRKLRRFVGMYISGKIFSKKISISSGSYTYNRKLYSEYRSCHEDSKIAGCKTDYGKLHREDGITTEFSNGTRRWYLHGKLHREDGPAVEYRNIRKWYCHGKLHRIDGPAVEYVVHEEDIIYSSRETDSIEICNKETDNREKGIESEYWQNGKLHREDGPALIYYGTMEWYINNILHRVDGPAVQDYLGNRFWYFNGELHREGGPAVEYIHGDKFWYLRNKLHREDGPAKEYIDGSREWYFDGKLHRLDGPAIERGSIKKWYIHGIEKL